MTTLETALAAVVVVMVYSAFGFYYWATPGRNRWVMYATVPGVAVVMLVLTVFALATRTTTFSEIIDEFTRTSAGDSR